MAAEFCSHLGEPHRLSKLEESVMDREDLKYIRSMKLSNDRRQDWTEKCRRDRRLFLTIMIVLVLLLGAVYILGEI